jgi:hypothetical protein
LTYFDSVLSAETKPGRQNVACGRPKWVGWTSWTLKGHWTTSRGISIDDLVRWPLPLLGYATWAN